MIDLLTRLTSATGNADVFVISPFRIVVHEMARSLENRPDLLRMLSRDGTQWLKDHVGTVHAFQGREAVTVILLLGAPSESQSGAREWAAGTPKHLERRRLSSQAEPLRRGFLEGMEFCWSSWSHE